MKQNAMINTGADVNNIPAALLSPTAIARYKTPPSGVKGSGGSTGEIDGKFKASVKSGSIQIDLLFNIMEAPNVTVLIGQDLTRRWSVDSVNFDNRNGIMSLQRKINGSNIVQQTTVHSSAPL